MLDRTTSDCRTDSELVSASGRLKARNSVSASGRSIRKGSTIRRLSDFNRSSAPDVTGIRNR